MPTCYQTTAAMMKTEMLLGYCTIMMSPNLTLVSRIPPGQEGFNNSPRCQRAPLCRPTYGPWWWHVVQGAWQGVCARGPTYWCQGSPGLQDAALLQGPLALGLALPWCTAMLTAQPAQKPREESQGDKHMQSFTCTCIHAVWTQNNAFEKHLSVMNHPLIKLQLCSRWNVMNASGPRGIGCTTFCVTLTEHLQMQYLHSLLMADNCCLWENQLQ